MIKHLDLFSGIGGFALAADWTFENVEHIFCEIEPFCQKILKKHWPNSNIVGDIKRLKVDNLGNLVYCDCDEQDFKIHSSKKPVRSGIVNSGNSELLRRDTSSNAQNINKEGGQVQEQQTLWEEEPFLQRDESRQPLAERLRICDTEGNSNTENTLRGVQGYGDIQERKDEDSGSPPRLQRTIENNVVVSEMPPQVAQESQSYSKSINETIKPFYETCQRQHEPVAKCGEIDLLTGGFP